MRVDDRRVECNRAFAVNVPRPFRVEYEAHKSKRKWTECWKRVIKAIIRETVLNLAPIMKYRINQTCH